MIRILTVAGSDPTCGAGLQADLQTITALGGWPMTAVTAITVQDSARVYQITPLPPELVAQQMRACLEDMGADAIKLGMLANQAIVEAVATVLADHPHLPVVADPVLAGTGGGILLEKQAMASYTRRLSPLLTLLTPNLAEAGHLTGRAVHNKEEMMRAASQLAAAGPAVLVTGGHLEGEQVWDLLYHQGQHHWFANQRLPMGQVHGTGCTLATAAAVALARGMDLATATATAIAFTRKSIENSILLGKGQRMPIKIAPITP